MSGGWLNDRYNNMPGVCREDGRCHLTCWLRHLWARLKERLRP